MGVHPFYSQKSLDAKKKELYELKNTETSRYKGELEKAKREFNQGTGSMTKILKLEKELDENIPYRISRTKSDIKRIEDAVRTGKYPDMGDGWGGTVPGKSWRYKDSPADVDSSYGSGKVWPESSVGGAAYAGALIGGMVGLFGLLSVPFGLQEAGANDSTVIKAALGCLLGGPISGSIIGGISGLVADAVKSGKKRKKGKK